DNVTVITTYHNDRYDLHGRLASEERKDGAGHSFQRRELAYSIEPEEAVLGADGLPIALDPVCIVHKHPLLPDAACAPAFPFIKAEAQSRAEIGTATKTRTMSDQARDRFGNVLSSTDSGDDAVATDDVFAQAVYQNDTTRWILGRTTSLEV